MAIRARATARADIANGAMPKLEQVLHGHLRPHAVIYSHPVQQAILRLGLTVNENSRDMETIKPFFVVAGEARRGHEDTIDAPPVERLDDRHFLFGVVMR